MDRKPDLADEVTRQGIELTEYAGPSSVHSLIVHECSKAGIEVISVWGHTPIYVRRKNSKATYYVLRKVARMMEMTVDLEDLIREGERLTRRLDREVDRNPQLRGLVESLDVEYRLSRRRPSYIT
ncbi:MAG: PAC2 family protein [Aigarchaeota archaeon]|nr:PAC2 family protein [Aigarchaeota archaeon]